MDNGFGSFHPAVNFIFFIVCIAFGMFFVHPLFLAASVLLSAVYYFSLRGAKGIKFALGMCGLFLLVTVINPLFNPAGETVLFTYFQGRTFTLEALAYGAANGGMFVSVMLWFSCYNTVMTSDKFIHLFGRLIPALSLILTMVLRLVPNFTNKTRTIAGARRCVGKMRNENKKEQLKNGMDVLSVLATWALEGAVVTADSMRSRGYGLKGRSSFAIYRFRLRDGVMMGAILLLSACVIVCAALGGMTVTYIPNIHIPGFSGITAVGLVSYLLLLAIPVIIHIKEAAIWRILRSKI